MEMTYEDGFFVIAYTVFRFFEHVLAALYHQKVVNFFKYLPNNGSIRKYQSVVFPLAYGFRHCISSAGLFLLYYLSVYFGEELIMFIFLIVFDVAFIPLRYYFQKKDIQYKPIKQELYELFMHIDHDPNDETYNKLVIYLNKMKMT